MLSFTAKCLHNFLFCATDILYLCHSIILLVQKTPHSVFSPDPFKWTYYFYSNEMNLIFCVFPRLPRKIRLSNGWRVFESIRRCKGRYVCSVRKSQHCYLTKYCFNWPKLQCVVSSLFYSHFKVGNPTTKNKRLGTLLTRRKL